MADFECKTKGCTVPDITSSESFSNYTVSLITAVTKLTRYLKEVSCDLSSHQCDICLLAACSFLDDVLCV